MISESLEVLPPEKLALDPAWDKARYWLEMAVRFETLKVFSQVNLGLEIIRLRKAFDVNGAGGDQKSNSHRGNSIAWTEIQKRELTLASSTGYRFLEMAKAALSRINKHPELKDFDPATMPAKFLPESKRLALDSVVHKLTDGKTQAEFCEEYGVYKNSKSGAKGSKPGHQQGGRKRIPLGEQNALFVKQASEDWFAPIEGVASQLYLYGVKFTVLPDSDVEAQIHILERALTARKTWLKAPVNQRDPKLVEKIIKDKKPPKTEL